MDTTSNLFLFGVTPTTAAISVWGVFKLLRLSQPLNISALSWLTNPTQSDSIQAQYMTVRNRLLGTSPFSRRRLIVVLIFFLAWAIVMFAAYLLPLNLNVTLLAIGYYVSAMFKPLFFAIFLVLAYVSLLLFVSAFDFVTISLFRFGNNLFIYLCVLAVTYYLVAIVASFFSVTSMLIFGPRGDHIDNLFTWLRDSSYPVFRTMLGVATSYQKLVTVLLSPWQLFQPYEDTDESIVFLLMLAVASANGISAMFVVSALGLTIINIGYALGLSAMRLEYFLREKYGVSQDYILKEPIEYIGRVACCLAFIVVVLCSIVVRISPPPDQSFWYSAK